MQMTKQTQIVLVISIATLVCLTTSRRSQAQQPASGDSAVIEQGKFTLHKIEQPIGQETYEIRKQRGSIAVRVDFKFTDRGTPVPLTARFRCAQDLTPQAFEIKGKTARSCCIPGFSP